MKTKVLKLVFCVFPFFVFASVMSSCTDENIVDENLYTTRFCVYECNEEFAENAATTSFVSIGAEITIWEKTSDGDEDVSYRPIDIIETGEDGKAVYSHSTPTLYYTVEKVAGGKLMRNLLSPLDNSGALRNKFQVAGIFSSDEDAEEYHKYNLPHLSESYSPKLGTIKFKDINGDGTIDLEDSMTKSVMNSSFRSVTEEIVYIAVDPNQD